MDKRQITQLRIVLVLTLIGSGSSCLAYILLGLMPDTTMAQMLQYVKQNQPTLYDAYETLANLPTFYCLLSAMLYALSVVGAILMWNLRKNGFHCYTLAQLLILLITVLFMGKAFLGLGDIMLTLLFITYYFLKLKQIGAFNDSSTENS